MNKVQKIIVSIWLVLLTIISVLTLYHYDVFFSGSLVEWAPEWGKFILLLLIISIPLGFIYKLWGDKK